MRDEELLYSKQFPQNDPDDAAAFSDTPYSPPDGDYIRRAMDSVAYRPLEGRREKRGEFLRAAAEVSELYRLDIEITESRSRVSAALTLGNGDFMGFLKPLIRMADDLGFRAEGGKVVMTLDFYTHGVYRGDRPVLPHGLEG